MAQAERNVDKDVDSVQIVRFYAHRRCGYLYANKMLRYASDATNQVKFSGTVEFISLPRELKSAC